jgi:steroid 5-alpha reductase family enzyme
MRAEHGEKKFWWYSLFSVFWLQAALSLLVSLPLAWIAIAPGGNVFTIWDFIGLSLWGLGFFFEAVGDWQLREFKKNPENKGKLLTTGLWSLTRHPNYFGDATLWWGFFFFALPGPLGYLSVFGPLTMSLFIYHVSGVKLLEKDLIKRKPDYADYIRQTPAFVPKFRKPR